MAEDVRTALAALLRKAEAAPGLDVLLDDTEADVLTSLAFPPVHWCRLSSTNPLERLNTEVKRRTAVVGTISTAAVRHVGAVLVEQHDEWQVGRRHVSV